MKLKPRFYIVGVGLVIFLLVTPVLVLFARGFKVDWENNRIIKTGTFVAKSDPDNAAVFIDGRRLDDETSTTARFLTPKDYDVRIEKEGYQPWAKRMSILPQLVTWANLNREFITLFLNDPELVSDIKTELVSVSAYQDRLVYLKDKELFVKDASSDEAERLGPQLPNSQPFGFTGIVDWQDASGVYKYAAQLRDARLTERQIAGIEKISANSDYMILELADNLYSLSPQSGLILIDTKISGFMLEGETAWYVQGVELKTYNLRTGGGDVIESRLPVSAAAEIIRGNGHVFLILDQAIYIVGDSLEKIYDRAAFASWSAQAGRLLLSNDNELLTFDPAKKNIELIHRSVSPITEAWLNAETGYVFFANEGSIKAIELDGRDHRNIYTIVALNQGERFIMSGNGRLVHVYSNSGIKTYRIR